MFLLCVKLNAAALGANIIWEVRTAGSDSNGGGFDWGNANLDHVTSVASHGGAIRLTLTTAWTFADGDTVCVSQISIQPDATTAAAVGCWVAASSDTTHVTLTGSTYNASITVGNLRMGVDYSQRDTPKHSGTDGLTGGTGIFSSVGYTFTTSDVGNTLTLSGGSPACTAGTYTITSVAAGLATLNASAGASAAGCTWAEGGAFVTLGLASTTAVDNNWVFVKSGTYNTTATITFAYGHSVRVIGYNATRQDNGSGGVPAFVMTGSAPGYMFSVYSTRLENLNIDCATVATCGGITSAFSGALHNVRVQRYTTMAIYSGSYNFSWIDSVEIDHGQSGCTNTVNFQTATSTPNVMTNSYIHDNACGGYINAATVFINNVVSNTTGGAPALINVNGYTLNSTFYNNAGGGVSLSANNVTTVNAKGNLFVSNGSFGQSGYTTTHSTQATWMSDGNAYWGNGGDTGSTNTHARSNMDSLIGINGVSPYVNHLGKGANNCPSCTATSASPLTNPGSADFSLNNIAGAGAVCRGTAPSGTFPALGTVGYPSFGALQPALGGAGGNCAWVK